MPRGWRAARPRPLAVVIGMLLDERTTRVGVRGPLIGADLGYCRHVRLIDRSAEKRAVDGVLGSVRAGVSRTLVLRGLPGVGKSALLDYAVESAADMQVVRTVAVEPEGDLFGRRRMFVIGLTGFAICSVLCAIAPSARGPDRGEGPTGIAGALLVPGSLAILASTFEGEARGRAVGLWTAWAGIRP